MSMQARAHISPGCPEYSPVGFQCEGARGHAGAHRTTISSSEEWPSDKSDASSQPSDEKLDSPLTPVGVLRELRAWMRFKLEYGPIKYQQPDAVYPMNQHPSGYAAVLVPDWDMRQKLALIEETYRKGMISMDTPSELAQDAAQDRGSERPVQCAATSGEYQCDIWDLNGGEGFHPCERCKKQVCDGHAKRRSVYWLCSVCDNAERATMRLAVAPDIRDLFNAIARNELTAEEVQLRLSSLEMAVAEIEGAADD